MNDASTATIAGLDEQVNPGMPTEEPPGMPTEEPSDPVDPDLPDVQDPPHDPVDEPADVPPPDLEAGLGASMNPRFTWDRP
jgi:hypothetical protein